jgi:hypothetical protein
MGAVWWSYTGSTGYLGQSQRDGLEFSRHTVYCRPGLWDVRITGWSCGGAHCAVIDDFGNLVEVFP